MNGTIASSIFRIQNFFDEISIIDTDLIIRYCEIFSSGTYSFTADDIVGKHLFEVFPSSAEENSEIYQVIKTGKPIASFEEDCVTYKGDIVKGYSSVYPLYKKNKLVGAAVALKFFGSDYRKEYINVQEHTGSRQNSSQCYTIDDIITTDRAMQRMKRKILKVSDMDSAVLIEGKTGTGKELVAQSLHFSSSRASMPFVSQNCSAIPGNLLESTLFGTEKGSFTGAITNKGLFELASGGTLFLDEINSMDLSLQAKLLKAIEEKTVRHLGGHEGIHVDVRIVAAINEDPFSAISAGRLRSDLFYRLNVISFRIPELRFRPCDIRCLSDYYVEYYNQKMKKNIKGLLPETSAIFQRHSWPGNVRELRNIIEGAFAVTDGDFISPEDLPEYLQDFPEADKKPPAMTEVPPEKLSSYQEQVEEFERRLLFKTIEETTTKTEAAKKLGMTKQALYYKLTSLGIKSE